MTTTWTRFSTEYNPSVIAIELQSDQGVRARIRLHRYDDTPIHARVIFEATEEGQARVACLHAISAVIGGVAKRVAEGRPIHVSVASVTLEPMVGRGTPQPKLQDLADPSDPIVGSITDPVPLLSIIGSGSWISLAAAFGDDYAEALP